jgi:hypothetical protein
MGVIKQMTAPIRGIVTFPLFQLAVVVGLILFLQAADDNTIFGRIFTGLDSLVAATVQLFAAMITVKSFTQSWLVSGFMIAYVYFACLVILALLRIVIRTIVDLVGRSNAFGLRNAIARERGIVAYRAWVPFERIRPASIPQAQWEETFAWPADNRPPYPPLMQRLLFALTINIAAVAAILILLQLFTPFPVITWLAALFKAPIGG